MNIAEVTYQFVNYGEHLKPAKNALALDVGMKTVPGVIDHHHPEAEVECTASLIAKYPHLVLDHIKREGSGEEKKKPLRLHIITHRLPDFDSLSSIFLSIKLLETGQVDPHMEKIALYTKMVDSSSLPKEIDLSSTPYSILRSLFTGLYREDEKETSQERIREGLKFMNFLYSKSVEGYEIIQNRVLFSGIDRYQRAMLKAENDYINYLSVIGRSRKVILFLPLISGKGKKKVDGLIIKNPRSFLLKDWAHRDRKNSSLQEGFSFLLTNFGNKIYILGVDPEKEVNLRGLGDMLNEKETNKRAEEGRPLGPRWYDGNCPFFNYRIIDAPQDVTSLSHAEIVEALLFFSQQQE